MFMSRFVAAWMVCALPIVASAGEWTTNYAEAFDAAKKSQKPIFVFFTDSTKEPSWKSRFAGMNEATDSFVLVTADKSTEEGAELFKTFEMTGNHGVAVVERTQQWQYFRSQKDLSRDELTSVFKQCKDCTGKPAASILSQVNSVVEEATTMKFSGSRASSYCPNCQRFR
jgi:hypothetical protein